MDQREILLLANGYTQLLKVTGLNPYCRFGRQLNSFIYVNPLNWSLASTKLEHQFVSSSSLANPSTQLSTIDGNSSHVINGVPVRTCSLSFASRRKWLRVSFTKKETVMLCYLEFCLLFKFKAFFLPGASWQVLGFNLCNFGWDDFKCFNLDC